MEVMEEVSWRQVGGHMEVKLDANKKKYGDLSLTTNERKTFPVIRGFFLVYVTNVAT